MTKHIFLMAVLVFLAQSVWAMDEESDGVTIIDPNLMNKGVWAEPYFRAPGDAPRETASDGTSQEAIASAATNEKSPDQYLDVLEKIPSSEPTIKRSWVEHKALSED